MKARSVRGCIVNLGSISGMRGCSYEDLPYQASKATIIALTRTAAAKLVLDGIRVNCVSPSMTRAPMLRGTSDIFQLIRVQAMLGP